MNGFSFRAHTIDGQIREGVIQAMTADDATRTLVQRRLVPEWVKPVKAARGPSFQFNRRVKNASLVLFARQFSTLIDAAVPMVQSLEVCQDLTEDRALRKALNQVIVDVQAGKDLAGAMREQPQAFSDIFVSMVEAGEQGGVLDTILGRLATYLEKSQKLVSRVKTAMVYPAIIIFVAVAALGVMLGFVVPTFVKMFESSNMTLPYPTQVLVNMSEFLKAYWVWIVGIFLGALLFLKQAYATRSGRLAIDSLLLRVPVLGDLLRKTAVARFSQSMSSLLTSGSNLIDAIIASSATAGNLVIEKAILRTRHAIEAGQGISRPLAESGVIPRLVSRMIEVGEQTGRLDEMFEKVAIFYEQEVDTAVERLMKALEPALIVVVGFILGGIVVALYMPIFEALTNVAK
ncbi:MAG: type II secretion system F family protein [Gemmatimonadetes bacterium]|uniref:Type II secretion system F family protein n=1 Tax=Candidatus Kutchimonas denitrificans TaxID=3056748 RepID=A0AAE4ZAI5_9BACT|nr:type II secretion system F family protein [Gemmatimonadota bacterium]NIR76339.1 type II secretion system F family protein [Candidatus Kutchimonas denitrificans]NIS02362.1 type II secretion system F family protein [Gemmatimonadota bacterium]NIT68181.1 type II secretion system F family protein [Gemmatimonadota bacterium]NIU54405.1 type II secretion system F family protein [Gemmatimonadota bacterium]